MVFRMVKLRHGKTGMERPCAWPRASRPGNVIGQIWGRLLYSRPRSIGLLARSRAGSFERHGRGSVASPTVSRVVPPLGACCPTGLFCTRLGHTSWCCRLLYPRTYAFSFIWPLAVTLPLDRRPTNVSAGVHSFCRDIVVGNMGALLVGRVGSEFLSELAWFALDRTGPRLRCFHIRTRIKNFQRYYSTSNDRFSAWYIYVSALCLSAVGLPSIRMRILTVFWQKSVACAWPFLACVWLAPYRSFRPADVDEASAWYVLWLGPRCFYHGPAHSPCHWQSSPWL